MPKTESTQQKLSRVRAPRVHITYDVEVGDAIELKELPFVVGVLGDFSGKPDEPLPRMKDRKLIEIDRDNFDKVLAGMKPRLAFSVENKLANDGSKTNVELRFNSMDDFEPDQVVQQVEPLRKLVVARQRLSDLVSKMDGNDKLGQLLEDVISNSGAQQQLSAALGIDAVGKEGKKENTNE
jgi:type VI secretion system protein ImpB